VDSCVKVGDRNILLALLSAERSWAELQSQVSEEEDKVNSDVATGSRLAFDMLQLEYS
jgi:hypothetical protein